MKVCKRYIFAAAAVFLLVCGVIFFIKSASDPVTRLEITQHSVEMKPGDTLPLDVVGYTESGEEASEKQMEKLSLDWCVHADNIYICNVDDDGILTALSPGVVNVQVYCEKNDLYSRSITVSIRE